MKPRTARIFSHYTSRSGKYHIWFLLQILSIFIGNIFLKNFEKIHFCDYFLQGNLLTLCSTSKLQFFYAEILPDFKNRPMPKTVNAICKQIIKVKKSYKISGMYFSSWEFWVCVFAPDTLCFKGLKMTS